jgi:membrane dipeptidase
VGFGSDFLGSENHTVGLESAAGLPAITYSSLQRGYSRGDNERIPGGNLLRVLEAVRESGR